MSNSKNILIVGAGEAGRAILDGFSSHGMLSRVCGFADDDSSKPEYMGKKILCATSAIAAAIDLYSITEVVVTIPSASGDVIRRIVSEIIAKHPQTSIRILPEIEKYFDKVSLSDLKEISFEDITGRSEVSLDVDSITRECAGKTALVTGAGGSIGSEICANLARFGIARLVAIGRGENSIYNLAKKLEDFKKNYSLDIYYKIADVRNEKLMRNIFDEFSPDIVFHAAAHKHVPIMEFNINEAVSNNLGGTLNMLEISRSSNAKFILVSTDKAVEPSSVMGATKRLCELAVLYYNRCLGAKSGAVRFGNVLGSRGSVINLFREQIEKGGPVTVTHPDMKRFFMSIPEASLLVINAAAYTSGGDIFMLDMGEMYNISDIAKKMIMLFSPDRNIEIIYTGLRPGEKLVEKLCTKNEVFADTENSKIKIIKNVNEIDFADFLDFLNKDLPDVFSVDSAKLKAKISNIAGCSFSDFHAEHDRIVK